jgi:hypothetical protein
MGIKNFLSSHWSLQVKFFKKGDLINQKRRHVLVARAIAFIIGTFLSNMAG